MGMGAQGVGGQAEGEARVDGTRVVRKAARMKPSIPPPTTQVGNCASTVQKGLCF